MSKVRRNGIPSNPCFRGFNAAMCRYVIAYGGAGSGKSINCAQKMIADLSSIKGLNLLCIRKNVDDHRQSTRNGLIKAVNTIFGDDAREVWQWSDSSNSDMTMKCLLTGNVILFRGVKDEAQREKMKSIDVANGKICRVWIEEATALMPYDFDIIDDRLRGGLPDGLHYQIYMTFNPVSSTHWIKARFFDRQDPDVYICHSTYKDNRFLDDAFKRKMEKDRELNPEHYQIYGAGEWGEKGGLILTNWQQRAVPQDLDAYDALSMGHDFGYNHADALLLLGWKDGELYVVAEHYAHDMTNTEIIAKVQESPIFAEARKRRVWMICDSAEPDRIREWQRAGWRARPVDKGKGKATTAAIDWLKAHRIYIGETCTNTAAEAGEWAWQRDRITGKYTDEPVPVNDDAMAALRYGSEPLRIAEARGKRRRIAVGDEW